VALSAETKAHERLIPRPVERAGRARREAVLDGIREALRGPILVYAMVHGVVFALGLWMIAHADHAVLPAIGAWDVDWYGKIAKHGYEHEMLFDAQGNPQQMRIAFFPLLPMLMRYTSALFDISTPAAGVVISLPMGLVAAAGIHRLLKPYVGHRTALLVVALWGAAPPAFVQSIGYTESLFVALSAWALAALVERRWLTAATLTAVAGLSRSTSFILVGVVGMAALIEAARTRNWRALGAMAIAPLGLVGYFTFLRLRIGRWDAWSLTETAPGWGNKVDFGKANMNNAWKVISGDAFGDFNLTVFTLMVMFGAMCLLYLLRERRLPWPVWTWTVAGALFTLLSQGNSSTGRYLHSFFPLFVPLASLLSNARKSSLVPFFFALAVTGAWAGAWVFGSFAVAP